MDVNQSLPVSAIEAVSILFPKAHALVKLELFLPQPPECWDHKVVPYVAVDILDEGLN